MSKHIAIFEPAAGGHQMEYARHLIVDISKKLDARFTLLTTPAAARHKNCERLARDFSGVLTVRTEEIPAARHGGYRTLGRYAEFQWLCAEMAKAALARVESKSIDFVVVPQLEVIGVLQLGLRRPAFAGKPWAGIATGVRFHHRTCGIKGSWRWIDPVQGFFFRRVLADPTLVRMATIDPYLPKAAANPKVVYCPDPCPAPIPVEHLKVREAYAVRPDSFVILVFGVIDRRKCLDVLLEGAARVASDIDLTVLVAGPQARNDVGATLQGAAARKLREAGRLVEFNRFILSGQDPDPVDAADAVWVFYEPNFVYSSSVLVHAARSARPVIARQSGIIGKQVEDYGVGFALESEAPEPVAAALTRLARDEALRRRMGEAGVRAFSGHDPAAFAAPIADAIVQHFGARARRDAPAVNSFPFERDARASD